MRAQPPKGFWGRLDDETQITIISSKIVLKKSRRTGNRETIRLPHARTDQKSDEAPKTAHHVRRKKKRKEDVAR